MEYTLLEEEEPSLLIEKVNEMIGKGWKLQGGVAVAGIEDWWYFQAMVKED